MHFFDRVELSASRAISAMPRKQKQIPSICCSTIGHRGPPAGMRRESSTGAVNRFAYSRDRYASRLPSWSGSS